MTRRTTASGPRSLGARAGAGALLAAIVVLPSCITRGVWRHDHDDVHVESCGTSFAMVRGPEGAALLFRPGDDDDAFRQRCLAHGPGEVLLLDPFEHRSTTAELLQRFADSSVRPRIEVVLVDGTRDGSLSFVVPRNVAGAEAEAWRRPGVEESTWCFTCGAAVHVFRTECRLVAVPPPDPLPPPSVSAYVARVRREPVSVGRQVLLTPFAGLADAVLLPFQLLTIGRWW